MSEKELKLDIGCGLLPLDGYEPVDLKQGKKAYPLDYPDGSVSVIRASHVLEHFSYRGTFQVLTEWARVLKDGGVLRISVPDFNKIVQAYAGENEGQVPIEQVLMGAHHDINDYHKAIFNNNKLCMLMKKAGFGDLKEWGTTSNDTSSNAISLNVQGTKGAPNIEPVAVPLSVSAVMSVPRLGFQDNFFSVYKALMPYNIPIHKYTGAFWGQCLERSIEEVWGLRQPDAILTIDYDSVFSQEDVGALIQLMIDNPEAEAICAMQMSRGGPWPLLTKKGPDGKSAKVMAMSELDTPLTEIATGHFGLTLIRTAPLMKMPHPWFMGEPNVYGKWEEGRVDDDIYFWRKWEKMGHKLYQANRIPIGHAELLIMWPGFDRDPKITDEILELLPEIYRKDGTLMKKPNAKTVARIAELLQMGSQGKFQTIYQESTDYWEHDKPKNCWR